MAKKKPKIKETFYKDYDVEWLRSNPDHPDFYLVAEYDAEFPVEELEEVVEEVEEVEEEKEEK